jgi:diguanylate cyclase (GGDEF)-like protein
MPKQPAKKIDVLPSEMHALERQELKTSIVSLLLVLAMGAALIVLLLGQPAWQLVELRLAAGYLRPLFILLVALVVGIEIYVFTRGRALSRARRDLVCHLVEPQPTERLAWVDELTALFNKRYFEEMLPRETSRANRRETSLTFLKMDITDFKKLNRELGSGTGDRVLQELAQLLKRSFRPGDLIVRYGGDEFLVVMPETTKHGGLAVIRRLLEKIEAWNRSSKIPNYTMELSFGLATYTKGADISLVLAAADQRVYLYRDQQLSAE